MVATRIPDSSSILSIGLRRGRNHDREPLDSRNCLLQASLRKTQQEKAVDFDSSAEMKARRDKSG
jgi:hypothetical protein